MYVLPVLLHYMYTCVMCSVGLNPVQKFKVIDYFFGGFEVPNSSKFSFSRFCLRFGLVPAELCSKFGLFKGGSLMFEVRSS